MTQHIINDNEQEKEKKRKSSTHFCSEQISLDLLNLRKQHVNHALSRYFTSTEGTEHVVHLKA